jgi:hypothetical protein
MIEYTFHSFRGSSKSEESKIEMDNGQMQYYHWCFLGPTYGKSPWDAVKLLKKGLVPSRRALPPKLKRADGSIATTPKESTSVSFAHFSTLYGRCPTFDPYVLKLVMQEACFNNLDGTPLVVEIHDVVRKWNSSSPRASRLHARLWQAFFPSILV